MRGVGKSTIAYSSGKASNWLNCAGKESNGASLCAQLKISYIHEFLHLAKRTKTKPKIVQANLGRVDIRYGILVRLLKLLDDGILMTNYITPLKCVINIIQR